MFIGYSPRSLANAGTVTPLLAVMAVKAHAEDAVVSGLGYWLVMVVFSTTAPVPFAPAASSFSVDAVPGETSVPACKMAFHAEESALMSTSCAAALLSAMILISPAFSRRPPVHSHTFPTRSAIPAGLLSCRQLTGPEPVSVRPCKSSLRTPSSDAPGASVPVSCLASWCCPQ